MAGYFDPREKNNGEHKFCLVKRLSRHLSTKEASEQLKAVFPYGWEEKTAERMRPYVDALQELIQALIHTKASRGPELKMECKPIFEKFRQASTSNPRGITACGYIFDPKIFSNALEIYVEKLDLMGGYDSEKSDLFMVHGFGFLQSRASVSDLQLFTTKKGVYHVVVEGGSPSTSLNFSSGQPPCLIGLGSSFFLSVYGKKAVRSIGKEGGIHGMMPRSRQCPLWRLHLQKILELRELRQPADSIAVRWFSLC